MFFVLSKLLGFFAIPSNLVVLIGIVGFGNRRKRRMPRGVQAVFCRRRHQAENHYTT
jgi:hypothetical protein